MGPAASQFIKVFTLRSRDQKAFSPVEQSGRSVCIAGFLYLADPEHSIPVWSIPQSFHTKSEENNGSLVEHLTVINSPQAQIPPVLYVALREASANIVM